MTCKHFVDNIFKSFLFFTVKWFQVFLSNTNNSIYYKSFGLVLWHINHWRLFNAKSIFIHINSSISKQFSLVRSSIWSINRTLSAACTPGQSGPGSDGSKGVLCIPQNSSITGASPSDCLVSYLGHSLEESYPSAEMETVYSTVPANWAIIQSYLPR